jgi:hypothetical protein
VLLVGRWKLSRCLRAMAAPICRFLVLPIAVEVNEISVVPRWVIDRFGIRGFVEGDWGSEGFEDRSAVGQGNRSPPLLIRR